MDGTEINCLFFLHFVKSVYFVGTTDVGDDKNDEILCYFLNKLFPITPRNTSPLELIWRNKHLGAYDISSSTDIYLN